MNIDSCTKSLLLAIALLLGAIALRPYVAPNVAPTTVQADSGSGYPVFVEPGISVLRAADGSQQVLGKVVVDLRNGNIWGFPTMTQDPYPAAGANSKPQTSHPFLLGRYALADIDK
ncbi:MAG TPA: hypothetical protein VHS34_18330 [Terriglobales bacterium]|nr:hypothetical protein [Terriglobales bacterium]